jgi:ABC-type spermidine/putrescine transport system permease subunit II
MLGTDTLGSLSPDERRALAELWWSRPLRSTQIMVFGGLATVPLGSLALFVLETSGPAGSAALEAVIFIAMVGGLAVGGVGLVLRRQAMLRLAFRPCPKCGQPCFFTSGFCRKCGTQMSN